MKDYIWTNKVYTGISIVSLIILWKFLSTLVNMEIILPAPETTFINLINISKSPGFLSSVLNTIIRSLFGFSLALIFAIILGVVAGIFKPIYYLLDPLVNVIKSTPTIGIILLALIWLRSYAPILIGFLIIFPVMYSNVIEGIYNIDNDLLEMARMYRVKNWRIAKDVYFPSIISYLLAGMTTSLGLNLKIVIAAEVIGQSMGSIGDNLYLEKIKLNTAGVFAWIIVVIIISWLFDIILRFAYKSIVKWN